MKSWILIFSISVTFVACKKPYIPPAVAASYNYLVIEGVVNSGNDSTFIKLSRTIRLSDNNRLNPEFNAIVTVEGDNGSTYSLTESKNGFYVSAGLNLDNSHKYRLRINAANGEQYLSDFTAVINSPEIDSVNFTIENNGINVNVNTHDAKNATRYYRWDYNETWRFHSRFYSYFKSNGDTVLARDLVNDNISTCWRSDTSSTILTGTSAKLAKDVISNTPITFISAGSEKLTNEYSVFVRQYALTSDAYTFWENLKKNTQELGSIFDAQPSQINGNIHCVSNPSLPAIGYLSIGSVSSQRIFIFNRELPAWSPAVNDTCVLANYLYEYYSPGSTIPVNQINQYINYNKGAYIDPLIPVNAIVPPGAPKPIGYSAAEPICVDCTLRGTNIQPAYWKYQ